MIESALAIRAADLIDTNTDGFDESRRALGLVADDPAAPDHVRIAAAGALALLDVVLDPEEPLDEDGLLSVAGALAGLVSRWASAP